MILNPRLVGRELGGIQVEIDDAERKSSVISQLEHVDGVVMVLNLIGRSLRTSFFYGDMQGFAKTVERIGAVCNSKDLIEWRGESPPCNLNLRRTDWEIIRASAKTPYAQHPTSQAKWEFLQRPSRDD